ncbi:MAG: DHH family phosphoesterase, partial [Hadesarchaea archaeon]|nr:DHH family phosphoesterase [Hadesarchaea archaeon]
AGVNQEIVKQAIDDGVLEARKGLKLVPRNSKIVECLTLSMKPYLPGVSGDEEAARELVESLEIDPDQILSELDLNEEKNLRDEILERVNIDPNESFKHALWGMMYTVSTIKQSTGPENSHEYVTMLDACEKLGEPEVGFSALFGNGEMRNKAIKMLQEYQNKTVDILSQFVSEKRNFKSTSNMKYIYTKDEVEPNMIGETLSLAIEAGLIIPDLPTLIMANSNEDKMKVSARAQPEYAMKGPNIGTILGKVSQELGGSGGGHDVAAAARFPRKRKDEFIARVDNYLKEALNEN